MATGRQERVRGVSLGRLRRWLLAGVVLLLLVLGGLLGYARYRARKLFADVPGKLGLHIKSETDGFTVSQSVKDHTVFTLHAAKAIQHENGKTTLHDVAITLYGPRGSNRTDSIRGDTFEYDQPNGVIQAVGDVHLDLASPAIASAPTKAGAKRIAVTTRGLVYLQKLGVAATDEPLEIVYGDLRGTAIGAEYDSDQGMLRLRKDVRMDGTRDGKRLHVTAADVELDRTTQVAKLHNGKVQSDNDTAAGDRVTVHLAKAGGIDAVEADGHASVSGAAGVAAESDRLDAHMGPAGKLQTVAMQGNVRFHGAGSTGSSEGALLHFSTAGKPVQLDMQRAVRVDSTGKSGEQDSLTADRLTAQLVQDGPHTALRDAVATGNASLRSTSVSTPKSKLAATGAAMSTVRADELHAVTALAGGKRYIATLDGTGHTHVDQAGATGETRSSSGDVLHATLRAPGSGPAGKDTGQLQTAVQTGHVIVTQHVPAGVSRGSSTGATVPAQDTRATAQRAEFDGATQQLVLTGAPVITAPGVQLAASRIVIDQSTGNTEATNDVKGTFVSQNGVSGTSDPVHVLAERATIPNSTSSEAHFFGGARPVRMWSSTAQLDAPDVDLDRSRGTLLAHSASTAGAQAAVHLTLPPSAKPTVNGKSSGATQIAGQQLTLTSASASAPGQLVVTGHTRMRTAEANVTADRIVAVLHAAAGKQSSAAVAGADLLSSGIDSVTASGNVLVQQPGRNGSGDKLLYTAADSRYQLTGTPSAPPRVNDSVRGVLTGTSLIFHGEDDSVEVAGEPGRRVHTEAEAGRGTHSR